VQPTVSHSAPLLSLNVQRTGWGKGQILVCNSLSPHRLVGAARKRRWYHLAPRRKGRRCLVGAFAWRGVQAARGSSRRRSSVLAGGFAVCPPGRRAH